MATIRSVECERCGQVFRAKRTNARYCSDLCRARASQARARGEPVRLKSQKENSPTAKAAAAEAITTRRELTDEERAKLFPTMTATRAELVSVGMENSSMGAKALKLAERIDLSTSVMGFAALSKEHTSIMREVMQGKHVEPTQVDELDERRQGKMNAA